MRSLNVIALFILSIAILLISVAVNAQTSSDVKFRPFVQNEYDPKDFVVSQAEFHKGNVLIRIIQAKNISRKYNETPYLCRAWIDIVKSEQTIFRRYFDDMDPIGFSYGLFIPEVQPPAPFFAVVKNGEYDGRLYLVHEDGKVDDLMGGFYFMTNDKRYLFSEYVSDGTGLVVFDLTAGNIVFSSNKIPYIHQWYVKDGAYFFTESEWIPSNYGTPTEKPGIAYFYDFKTHQIILKKITAAEIVTSKALAYDFDPRDYKDCMTEANKSLKRERQQTPAP
jgi:hypothetical protein